MISKRRIIDVLCEVLEKIDNIEDRLYSLEIAIAKPNVEEKPKRGRGRPRKTDK